jgi:CRISPR system Cascade subunit CasA
VKELGILTSDLAMASGYKDNAKKRKTADKDNLERKKAAAMEEAYFRLDAPFRTWLVSINPKSGDMDDKGKLWKGQVRQVVTKLAEELIEATGNKAFIGKIEKEDNKAKNKQKKYVNAPNSFREFNSSIKRILNNIEG